GPENWTVGAPATAPKALSVGAHEPSGEQPLLYEPKNEKELSLTPLPDAPPWQLEKDYVITEDIENAKGNIVMIDQQTTGIGEKVKEAQNNEAQALIVHVTDESDPEWQAELEELIPDMPVAVVSEE